jgi:hypothetical protein
MEEQTHLCESQDQHLPYQTALVRIEPEAFACRENLPEILRMHARDERNPGQNKVDNAVPGLCACVGATIWHAPSQHALIRDMLTDGSFSFSQIAAAAECSKNAEKCRESDQY